MIIEIPVPYQIRLLQPGRKTWNDYNGQTSIALKIRELSSDQAPVVLSADTVVWNHSDVFYKFAHHQKHVRCVDYRVLPSGQMVRPLFLQDANNAGNQTLVTTQSAARDIAHFTVCQTNNPQSTMNPFRALNTLYSWNSMAEHSDKIRSAGQSESTLQSEHRKLAEEYRAGAAFIDGILYVPSKGPGIIVNKNKNLVGLTVVNEFSHISQSDMSSSFGFHQLSQARMFLCDIAEQSGLDIKNNKLNTNSEYLPFSITDPDIPHVDTATSSARATAHLLYSQGCRWDGLHKLSTAALRAFATAKEESEVSNDIPLADPRGLFDKLDILCDELIAGVRPRLGGPIWKTSLNINPLDVARTHANALNFEPETGVTFPMP